MSFELSQALSGEANLRESVGMTIVSEQARFWAASKTKRQKRRKGENYAVLNEDTEKWTDQIKPLGSL